MSELPKSPIPLGAATLHRLHPGVQVPTYDRGDLPHSIVHLSVGGFHRAHQAVYLDDLLHRAVPRWGICGVGLLPQDARMRDVLRAQDCLYTVVERSAAGDRARVIGAISAYLFAPDDPEAVLEMMAAPECRIVSLTITEGGYFVHPGTGEFDEAHPDVQHDLAHPEAPRGSFGYLAEALDRRRRRGLPPFTVQSPTLRDQLARIGTEGSARIPKFVLPSILDRVERGGPLAALTFTVASWFRYLAGTDPAGQPLPINDPMAEELVTRARAGGEDPGALLGLRKLFGDVLPGAPAFVGELVADLRRLYRDGPRAALAAAGAAA